MRRRSKEEVRELLIQRSIVDENGCWIWQGAVDPNGYGLISARSITESDTPIRVHVATWILYRAESPKGHHVHHLCEVRGCINPDHLQLLPIRTHHQMHKPPLPDDSCAYGHRGRIRRYESGRRSCLECDVERKRRKRDGLRNIR